MNVQLGTLRHLLQGICYFIATVTLSNPSHAGTDFTFICFKNPLLNSCPNSHPMPEITISFDTEVPLDGTIFTGTATLHQSFLGFLSGSFQLPSNFSYYYGSNTNTDYRNFFIEPYPVGFTGLNFINPLADGQSTGFFIPPITESGFTMSTYLNVNLPPHGAGSGGTYMSGFLPGVPPSSVSYVNSFIGGMFVASTEPSCATVLNDSISISTPFNTSISATLSNTEVAKSACDVIDFKWYNKVIKDPDVQISAATGNMLSPPYVDTVGAQYEFVATDTTHRPYYTEQHLLEDCELSDGTSAPVKTASTFTFCDTPMLAFSAPDGSYVEFETFLVGINRDGSEDKLYQISWKSDFTCLALGYVCFGETIFVDGSSIRGNLFFPQVGAGSGAVVVERFGSLVRQVPEPASAIGMIVAILVMVYRRERNTCSLA